ncbi:putative phytosulfokines 6 [Cynara cardunculus var. scolymus]|uniref:Phytosulfokine n=1 Tax=Cynara cardunculus var. scolymus TaxID=59895 RepID=A0A118JTQ2_CYNCS|nr:putative phytosulfokines 6 [Cynara cardunculus var. scolymus]KVH90687.1 hypothetical protein Ccrd_007279 [Cynara cardunculus var. scolymus]
MKHSFHSGVPLIIILLSLLISFSHTSSARFLDTKPPGETTVKLDESINTSEGSLVDLQTINSFYEVMGMEECGSRDEECLKRRVLAEAHLDYIYTQHHRP